MQSPDTATSREYSASESSEDLDVHFVDTGSKGITSTPVNKLNVGDYCMINKRPCKIVQILKCKPGKHGHAKAIISGIDLFNSKRYEAHLPASHSIEVPIVERNDYQLISINDDPYVQLLDLKSGELEESVTLGDDSVSDNIREAYQNGSDDEIIVTVLSALDESIIVDMRKSKNSKNQQAQQEQ